MKVWVYSILNKPITKVCFVIAIILTFVVTTQVGAQSPTSSDPGTASLAKQITLVMNGPASVNPNETFNVTVEAQNVPAAGIYGVQFEINYDPDMISVGNLQVNPDLSFVLIDEVDNVAGKITLVASREGKVPGLSGNVILLTFEATASPSPCKTCFIFEDIKIGDSQANPFYVNPKSYCVTIGEPTPEPTDEPTAEPTDEPTAEPTDEPTAEPTDEPTAEPTDEPTAEPTDEPTAEPTDEPTAEPTDEPTPEPTDEPTAEPTDEPTAEPTDEPTPEPTDEPTPEPTTAPVSGQVILAGRADNDWSDAVVTVDDSGQSATTDTTGNFNIADVTTGLHSSITADAVGFLSAVCTSPNVISPETNLQAVTLVSGDINDDEAVDIGDATAIGISFGSTEPGLDADINRDQIIDIFDLILVSVNFGETGPKTWVCQ